MVLSDEVEVTRYTGRDSYMTEQIVHYFVTEFELLNATSCG